MPGVDSFVVFFPRFTTLVAGSYTSVPLDVSKFGGVQLEAWRAEAGPTLYVEESLDGVAWQDAMSSSFDLTGGSSYASKFLSFGFRLRWFRVRLEATQMMTVYVEGIMRAGGGGAREWLLPRTAATGPNTGTGPGSPKGAIGGPSKPQGIDVGLPIRMK